MKKPISKSRKTINFSFDMLTPDDTSTIVSVQDMFDAMGDDIAALKRLVHGLVDDGQYVAATYMLGRGIGMTRKVEIVLDPYGMSWCTNLCVNELEMIGLLTALSNSLQDQRREKARKINERKS